MRSTLTELKKWEIRQLWILYQWINSEKRAETFVRSCDCWNVFHWAKSFLLLSVFRNTRTYSYPSCGRISLSAIYASVPCSRGSDFVHRAKRCGKENCEGVWVGSFLLSPSRYLPPYFFSALWLCAVLHHLNAQNRLMHLLNIYPWLCGQRLRKNSRDSCHTVWNYILIFFWK